MAAAERRPNLLLIMTDQQRFDQIGYASGGQFATPNLDRLARQGVIFDSAYSGSTVCIPARTSLLTGLLDHRVPKAPGSYAMEQGFWTVAHALRCAGYRTGLVGKMHLTPIHARHGFDVMRMCEHLVPQAGYGADDVDDYHKWLLWQGRADFRATHHFGPGLESWQSEFDNWYSAVPFAYDRYFHPTDWIKRESIDFLTAHAGLQPFLLIVSFPHPHSPYDPPEPYASMFDASEAVLPDDTFDLHRALPPAFRDAIAREAARAPELVARRIVTFIRALVNQIDDAIGDILGHVDLTSTTVFFTSDHGDYSGHRGMVGKEPWISFDDLARVPFFCAGRGVAGGRRIGELVQSSDFALTSLELAGVELPSPITETRSLAGVLRGEPADAERAVFCCTSLGWPMVRQGSLKYFLHEPSGDEMLFDVASDPRETRNLIAERGYAGKVASLRRRLRDELARGVPDLPRFEPAAGAATSSGGARAAAVRLGDARTGAEQIADAFRLLATESLVPGAPAALFRAAVSALGGSVESAGDAATPSELAAACQPWLARAPERHHAALAAMAAAVDDPHTLFFGPEAARDLFAALAGEPCNAPGFCAHRASGAELVVSEVFPGGPAAAAGLTLGDVIVTIDGRSAAACRSLLDLWFRPTGSELALRLRGGDNLRLSAWPWQPPLVSWRVSPAASAGVLRVHVFAGARGPGRDFRALLDAALAVFERKRVTRIALDLRGSFGVTGADALVSAFSAADPLAHFRARDGQQEAMRRNGETRRQRYQLAVLVDEQTTTGAAYAAAALRDVAAATIVGQPTRSVLTLPKSHAFGSGALLYVPHFAMLAGAMRAPRAGHRLLPDRVVANRSPEELAAGSDPQLDAALSALSG